MPRASRCDEPGRWHHVFNRAVSKRPLFLCGADFRQFLSCLARESRRRLDIEIHAYALMLNHYHLLVRSIRGRLDAAMQRIQTRYARYLNRRLKRDGSLFKNRFKSRPVRSNAYHHTLVRYIDSNPVAAQLVARPELYAWGSASKYAAKRRPRWLTTSWIDAQVTDRTGCDARVTKAYRETFPVRCDADFVAWVERRLKHSRRADDDLDLILGATPERTRAWMLRKARLADGEARSLPIAGAQAILDAITALESRRTAPTPNVRRRGRASPQPGDLLRAGLLRDVAALSWAEIARRLSCPDSTAHERCVAHRRKVVDDAEYAAMAAQLVQVAVRTTLGVS